MRKNIFLILFLLNVLVVKAQEEPYVQDFKSSYYTINDGERFYENNTIYITDDSSISHSNGLKNYPIVLDDIKNEGEEWVSAWVYKPNVTPRNYNSFEFKYYGFRAFKIYREVGVGMILIVEIIQDYHTKKTKTIKYYP